MIIIHYDFTDGTELSYKEGLEAKDYFTTNCLDFFTNDEEVSEVVVIDKRGNNLLRSLLMKEGDTTYTKKHMRPEHDLQKMLKSNSFNWQKL